MRKPCQSQARDFLPPSPRQNGTAPKWRAVSAQTGKRFLEAIDNVVHGHYIPTMSKTPGLLGLLVDKNMTITDLAKATGLSVSFLSRLVSNKRWPGVQTAIRVARVLGVKVEAIWHEEAARPQTRKQGH
jgi:lambda repressor-like predicted transcriptional regulator